MKKEQVTRNKHPSKTVSSIRGKLGSRTGAEREQALIRILLTAIFLVTFYILNHPTIFALTVAYLVISVAIYTWIHLSTASSHIRKVIGILGDITMTSLVLYLADEAGILAFFVYLWVIIGNGFRYGALYLKISTLLSISGTAIVLGAGYYWSDHFWVGFVMILSLTILPIYMANLLRKLHSAIDIAEEANAAKSQFLANMSHELRTPLNGIIGASELLTLTPLDKKQQKYAHLIQSSGHTLLSLIEDVLDISKIEAGKQTIESTPFDLHELINTTTQIFQPQADGKNVKLISHVAPDVPFLLHGDELHIRQVLMNFISNALKFTEEGSVKILVTLSDLSSQSQTWINFSVIDTGIGLSEEAQEQVFNSFTQADSSVTRKYGGTGLGTTISKELVELMGGKVGINSKEGKGSEFWFQLPLERQAAQKKEDIAVSTSFSDARILTLLNDSLIPEFINPIHRWGQEIKISENVIDFITELTEASKLGIPFHIAIVGESSLGMSPEKFIETVRKKIEAPSTSFILVGDGFDQVTTTELINSGFFASLTTPLNESLLFNAIHEICIGEELHINVPSIVDYQQRNNQLPPLQILVAEDNEVNQIVIREFLENMGHEVFIVEDGEEALDTISDENLNFDLALLDINMPNMSGLEVLKAYRFLEVGKRLPIVILSADATATNIAECMDAGADDYLTKPVEHRKLSATIEKLAQTQKGKSTTLIANKKEPIENTQMWSHINADVLDELSTSIKREHFVEDIITTFLKSSTEKAETLAQMSFHPDAQAFADIIHSLKGSSGLVGATAIYKTCEAIEQQHNLTPEIMRSCILDLNKSFEACRQEFMRYIETRNANNS